MGISKYYSKHKITLKDGTVKTYTYYHEVERKSTKKETLFDKLIKYDEIIKILKNNSVKKSDKVKMIYDFVNDNDDLTHELKEMTQITNFVYRYTRKFLN